MESGGRSREGGNGGEGVAVPSKFKKNFLSSTFHPQCYKPELPRPLSAGAAASAGMLFICQ